MKYCIIAFSVFYFLACNSGQNHNHNNNAAIPKTASDSLYKHVMDGHNRGMAKMGEIKRYKNLAKQKQDSIAKLKTKPGVQLSAIDSVVHDLGYAEELMYKWMDKFDPDKAGESEQEKKAFYTIEKQKVDTVEMRINSSIQRAKKVLD